MKQTSHRKDVLRLWQGPVINKRLIKIEWQSARKNLKAQTRSKKRD